MHPEYWPKADHDRFEDRVTAQIADLQKTVWMGIGIISALVVILNLFGDRLSV